MYKLWMALMATFALAVGCGGLQSEAIELDEQSLRAASADAVAVAECAPVADADAVEGDVAAEELAPCANGYCCNQDTGNVSKTSQRGCNGANDVWHVNLAACLGDPVCGSPSSACRIN